MSKDSVLKKLKERKKDASIRKRAAYQDFDKARNLSKAARRAMALARADLASCRDKLNQAFEAMIFARDHIEEFWTEYHQVRDRNNPQIRDLCAKANAEHAAMKESYASARDARNLGKKSEAASYNLEVRDHEDRRNSLNFEVANLVQEVRSAKEYALAQKEIATGAFFRQAKDNFDNAKSRCQEASEQLGQCEAERRRLWDEFTAADADYICAKNDLDDYLGGR